jgi:putative membrane protein
MTIDALGDYYLWVKSFHVISMVAWMAGLFYLPRLYVYHCDLPIGSVESERFKLMEYRLFKQIMNPAMMAPWFFGLLLVLTPGVLNWASGWWHTKLFCVILMTAFHMALGRWRKDFMRDANSRRGRFYRIANELPTVLMVIIVIMVIVKPFN